MLGPLGLKKIISLYSTLLSANTINTVNLEEQTMNTLETGSRLWLLAYLQVKTFFNSSLKSKAK